MDCSEKAPGSAPNTGNYSEKAPCFSHPRQHHLRFKKSSVLLPVVMTLIATRPQDSEFLKILAKFCYPRWALEAFVIANAERYSGVWLITRCGSLLKSGYNLHDWNLCIIILTFIGIVSRAVAFFCMVTFQKK